MSEVNELILKKLQEYPPSVFKLAKKAIELAGLFPEPAVAEQLKSVIRQVVREDRSQE